MLLSFSFQHSFSFVDFQTLSLVRPKKLIPKFDERVTWLEQVSPISAIYGANASGKSALFNTFALAIDNVRNPSGPENHPLRIPNLLVYDNPSAHPSTYEFRFIAPDDNEYNYLYKVTDTRVLYEELTFYPSSGRGNSLYKREYEESTGTYAYRYGKALSGEKKLVERLTKENSLFLTASRLLGQSSLHGALSWFEDQVLIYNNKNFEAALSESKDKLKEGNTKFKERFISFLRHADLGITDIQVVDAPQELIDQISADLSSQGPFRPEVASELVVGLSKVELSHQAKEGARPLNWPFESTGTQILVATAPILFRALENGATIFIDEIDMSLHPLIVRAIIEIFNNPETNPKQAQLIFSTHDVSLLNTFAFQNEAIARDQIWITEKDENGASQLYSVADFLGTPRKNDSFYRRYLSGQYGGIPRLENLGEGLYE